ncbi:MAG TPA: hypothetical protein ENF78_03520 [Candidatus Bathyarchaeota archaeon]|nr:hypothetical protein [Candidatus Bathyarchaeota archaeon]
MAEKLYLVKSWFKSRGFEPIEVDELGLEGDRPDMAFRGPQGLAFVLSVGEKAVGNRSYFTELVMKAVALREKCNFLYLAAPRLVATVLDTEVLRKHAIGLLVIGDERVIEALASPYKPVEKTRLVSGTSVDADLINELLSRLELLEQRIGALEAEITSLRPLAVELSSLKGLSEQVNKLSARIDMISRRLDALSARVATPAPPTRLTPTPSQPQGPARPELEGLPSFFKDNPWLEILARRGQDEVPS